MSYLTDTEKRLLFSALRREKEVCKKIDAEKAEDATCKMLVPIVNSLEKKFYYDRFEKEIRDKVIEEFSEKLKEKCDSMISEKWNSEVAPISWANAYADFKDDIDEIADLLKEVGE